jgi:hypothetical protein
MLDGDGEVECFCKTKPTDCLNNCNEYVMKLIPIKRGDKAEDLALSSAQLNTTVGKFNSELRKVLNKAKRGIK